MKKIINYLLVIALLISQMLPTAVIAITGSSATDKGTITVSNAVVNNDYKVYKVLELESFDTEKSASTYKVEAEWEEFFTTGAGKDYLNFDTHKVVTNININEENAQTFAQEALKYAEEKNITPIASKTADSATLVFEDLPLGYYLVDSTVGVLCNLTNTKLNITISDKNGLPTIDKTVKEDSISEYGKANTASIGQTVEYKTIITVESGAKNYVLYDTMTEGLTFDSTSLVITDSNNKTLVKDVDYTLSSTETYTFIVDFTDTYENTMTKGNEITVAYTATLNENAVIAGEGNINKTSLSYGQKAEVNKTPEDITRTYTYEFDLVKTDSTLTVLDGAEFRLCGDKNCEKVIDVVLEEDGSYRIAKEGETGVEIKAGFVTISGLDTDTYYLEETKAPFGFNKLTSPIEVVINNANNSAKVENNQWVSGGVQVTNLTGAELPSTGGTGTILFIAIGSIMVIGFGLLLVAKLRVSKEY